MRPLPVEAFRYKGSDFPGAAALAHQAEKSGDPRIELAGRLKPDDQVERSRLRNHARLGAGVVSLQTPRHANHGEAVEEQRRC